MKLWRYLCTVVLGLGLLADARAVAVNRAALGMVDFDGDGIADVNVCHPSGSVWGALKSASTGRDQLAIVPMTPGDNPVAGDFDGDHKTDLATTMISEDGFLVWTIQYNPLATPAGSQETVVWGVEGDVPFVGDFDGDGQSDLGLWRVMDETWQLGTLAGRASNEAPVVIAEDVNGAALYGSGSFQVPADYDGDLKTDMAVYTPVSGVLQIIYAPFTGEPETRNIHDANLPFTLIPAPGYYDGDNVADFAVYALNTDIHLGVWAYIGSTDSALHLFGRSPLDFISGSLAVGDYDGDGKYDGALYDNDNWFFSMSADGSQSRKMFGGNGMGIPSAPVQTFAFKVNSDSGGSIIAQEDIGPEENCGPFIGSRPSIALDSKLQPHIVIDKGTDDSLYLYHKINGVWSERQMAKGSRGGKYDASRIYLPHIEIDAYDRAWISSKFGCKEYGSMLGQGLWMYGNVATSPYEAWFKWVSSTVTHKGNGNVGLDPYDPNSAIVMATDSRWAKINSAGSVVDNKQLNLTGTGEKVRFEIAPRPGQEGVWHVVGGGYSAVSSSYQNSVRYKQGLKPVVWAAYSRYPEQGGDFEHPGVGIDSKNPLAAYISVVYSPGLLINIWDGTKMVFPVDDLPKIAAISLDSRFPPQWAPARNGGAFLCWTQYSRIQIMHVKLNGTLGPIYSICPGAHGSIVTDKDGNLHLAYVNGGMRYRKILTR